MRARAGWLAALLVPVAAATVSAQEDSVTVVPSSRYEAGALHEALLGSRYRDLWATPIRVAVLDLATFAGGLEPVRRGGGQQTRSLRFRAADGREFNFRSVDKWVSPDPREDLEGTVVERLVQDQVSSLHPTAVVVATGLLDAVGVPNPAPRLVVMPDDPRLGEFREGYAGLLGTIELHAEGSDEGVRGFGGAEVVEGAEELTELILASPGERVDARAYLRERLMSLLLGDWDRHADQYRWAGYADAGYRRWVPIPEDRDYAFSDYDGIAIAALRSFIPEMVRFGERYPASLAGHTQNSAETDRRFLAPLARPAWEEMVASLRRDLTDAEIDAAVRRMPPEHRAASGDELARALRARRDALPEVAERLYLQLSREPEVHATDAAERVAVQRREDGSLRVLIAPVPEEGDTVSPPPLFDRVFVSGETREVRIYLHGGADAAVVEGTALSAINVRVIGGAGADTLVDRARGGGWVSFHDSDEAVRFDRGPLTIIDRSAFEEPLWIPGENIPPVDFGGGSSWFAPTVAYEGTEGLIIGGGPSFTWHGFRRFPHAARARLVGLYGLGSGGLALDGSIESVRVGSTASARLHARFSTLEAFRLHGLGNESPADPGGGEVIVRPEQRLVEASFEFRPYAGLRVSGGPVIEWLDPRGGSAPGPAYGKAGLSWSLDLDTDPDRGSYDGGFRLEGGTRFFPAAWDVTSPFARTEAVAAAFAALPGRTLLAARLGAAQLLGDAPLLESVSLGGSATLRGHEYQRFTGDASTYAGVELRRHLARVRLVVKADLGALLFADAGRVFVDGVSTGGWHTAHGAGLSLSSLGRTLSLTWSRGERDVLYLKLGHAF